MNSIPDELISTILSYLSPYRERDTAAHVCRQWRSCINELAAASSKRFERHLIGSRSVQWYRLIENHANAINNNGGVGGTNGPSNITSRQHTAACYSDHTRATYVFGGVSSSNANTGFNDLLRLDMSTLSWCRPLVRGCAPAPLSNASLVSYKNTLILYGGVHLTELSPFGPGTNRVSNQLYLYHIDEGRWKKADYLDDECPPPMLEKSSCVSVHDADLQMDSYFVLGNPRWENNWAEAVRTPKQLWCFDLHTLKWCAQTLLGATDETLQGGAPCHVRPVHKTAYSSALLVTSVAGGRLRVTLMYRTSYDEWTCKPIEVLGLPSECEPFFKRSLLAAHVVNDTLALFVLRPSVADLFQSAAKVAEAKLICAAPPGSSRAAAAASSFGQQSPAAKSRELSFATEFVTVFLLDLRDLGKESQVKWIPREKYIDPCLTVCCPVRLGTVLFAREEYLLVGESKRNSPGLPVYLLRDIPD